jgi:hypothetical protein
VNVLTADPIIPAINAPMTAWLTNFGIDVENHSAIPGNKRYPTKPTPNPINQNTKTANPLDKSHTLHNSYFYKHDTLEIHSNFCKKCIKL